MAKFLRKPLNGYRVFQSLNSFHKQDEVDKSRSDAIIAFLYRASCLLTSLEAIKNSREMALNFIQAYEKQLTIPDNTKVHIAAEPLFAVYVHIPASLSSIVIMQNQLLILLRHLSFVDSAKDIPSSLNKAMKKIDSYISDQNVQNLLLEYWSKYGSYIRDVRDINEHFYSLIDNSFFIRQDNGESKIAILLPDNPEVKSKNKFTYNNKIDACDVLWENMFRLSDLVNQICLLKGFEESPFSTIQMSFEFENYDGYDERTIGVGIDVNSITNVEGGVSYDLNTVEVKHVDKGNGEFGIVHRLLKPDWEAISEQS